MPSRKAQVTKTAVVAKAVLGDPIAKIARDLEMSRDTVRRILNESEFATLVNEGKSSLYECIPEAVRIYGSKVATDPVEAKDFLERVTVLPSSPKTQSVSSGITLNFRRDPVTPAVSFPERPALDVPSRVVQPERILRSSSQESSEAVIVKPENPARNRDG